MGDPTRQVWRTRASRELFAMTTNPETAGVEPVALAEAFLADYHMNLSCWPQDMALRVAANRVLAPALSLSAAREDGERERPGCVGTMGPDRAIYFLERFKRDEKMLGLHEQWALDFAIAALSRPAPEQAPEPSDDAMWTVFRVGQAWGACTGSQEDADEAAARVIQEYGDRRAAEALAAMPAPDHANCAVGEELADSLEALATERMGKCLNPLSAGGKNYDVGYATGLRRAAEIVRAAMPTPAAIRDETT